ncbi:MAG: MlaD family protein [Steroidobacteraceae bacterium]
MIGGDPPEDRAKHRTSEEPRGTRRRRTTAGRRKTWWPGWIWAIPLAAVGIVVWLMLRALSSRGIGVTVVFDDADGMAVNSTKVLYHGLEVGTVTDLTLAPDGHQVLAHLDIDGDMRPYITAGTRFYLMGAHPSLADPASLRALISGPSIELVPGAGKPAKRFLGIEGKPPEPLAVAIPYTATFEGAMGDIQSGSPVMLGGFEVGEVAHSQLVTDGATGAIETRVVLHLDPTRFHIEGAQAPPSSAAAATAAAAASAAGATDAAWTTVMNATLDRLVRHGLRAAVTQTPPLIGNPQVTLEMLSAGTTPASLDFAGRYPRIPTAAGGGITALTQELGRVPVDRIAGNVEQITVRVQAIAARVQKLADSPQLDDSIRHLDRTLAELDRTMHAAGPQVAPTLASVHRTVDSLRRTASDIDRTAAAAQLMMNGSAAAPGASVQQALRELTDAARSIRSLADYLDRHPEALIRGRK